MEAEAGRWVRPFFPVLRRLDHFGPCSRGGVKALFALYLEWCELMRINVNIGKCSVTRHVKPASATQKGRLSVSSAGQVALPDQHADQAQEEAGVEGTCCLEQQEEDHG